jgi:hypothetical protein
MLLACCLSFVIGCGDTPTVEIDSAAQPPPPSAETLARAKEARFDDFRELARAEQRAMRTLREFKRSKEGRTMTADELAEYDRLFAAVKPHADAINAYLEREDITNADREALLHIYGIEIPAEFPIPDVE